MSLLLQIAGALIVLCSTACQPVRSDSGNQKVPALETVAIHFLDTPGLIEPSGLTMVGDTLFLVADKSDSTVYRIEPSGNRMRVVPHLQFSPPQKGTMDWEGITADAGGSFYLISERRGRLLQVTPDGISSWITPDLRSQGRDLGMFTKMNAGFEGVAWLGPQNWLAAAEREERGLVEWWGSGEHLLLQTEARPDSPFKAELPLLRLPDYSGLHADGRKVYALFRNAHLVVRLEKSDHGWIETRAWSYRHVETDPEIAYQSQTYGQAEGLVVKEREVYIVFDNNLGTRISHPGDRRPMLLHARFPENASGD